MWRIIFATFIIFVLSFPTHAEDRYFLGTRNGWERTKEVFKDGRYKEQNLFIIIGAEPTTLALYKLKNLKSKSTYFEDIETGGIFFKRQLIKSAKSFPINLKMIGYNFKNLFLDPVTEIKQFSLITPAKLIYKTVVNCFKIGWYGIIFVGEPVIRTGAGTLALVGAPLMKPVVYTGIASAYTVTAVYGYGSSLAAGSVTLSATGVVTCLDIATSPMVAIYSNYSSKKEIQKNEKADLKRERMGSRQGIK